MTQEEFAKMIDVRQDYISRIEKSPGSIDFNLLLKIADATGTSLDELAGYKKSLPEALVVSNTWDASKRFKDSILSYITTKKTDLKISEKYEKMIDELLNLVTSTLVKPKVAVVGMSDAGKSRLINSLLGMDKIPTSWTPTTSISIHIRHVDDRPTFMDEEAWIFKGDKDGFDSKKLDDEVYCKQRKIAGGNAGILSEYGTRQGDKYDLDDAAAAVVYLDSPILQICELVDLPGFGTGDRKNDDILARKSREFADVVIYLSIANGFLRGTDIEFLKSTLNSLRVIENPINNLEPLSNLFIVASQAHTVNNGSKSDLETILDGGAKRLFNEIPEEIWENRQEQAGCKITLGDLRKRFFTYTTDKPYLRADFESNLAQLLECWSSNVIFPSINTIHSFLEDSQTGLDYDIAEYEGILKEREIHRARAEQIENAEPERQRTMQKKRSAVDQKIKEFHEETKKEFYAEFYSVITVDYIVDLIKQKGYKKKKDDMERLAGFLSSKLQGKLQNVLKHKTKELNEVINEYLEDFTAEITKFKNPQLKGFDIPFDAVKIFASGLAGLATFGGLAIWASTLGNLGAYILVAKGVSVLSALGISVAGGTAGAASAVAALGGPVTLGIALAVIVGISVFALISGGWQKSVAKKIVKEYEKNQAYELYATEIDNFWNSTKVEFETAADHLEKEWHQYVHNLNNMVTSYSVNDICDCIDSAKEMKDFLVRVPLKEPLLIEAL
ncbi:hypothetical protein AM500_04785 [Bacillus sp. FJAT-18017]|nr:hypothetical protein AM500_04785 [Bacillus sp. FJAT-18017]